MKTHEFRVRPVTRYVVTEYYQSGRSKGQSEVVGEYSRLITANAVAVAMAKEYLAEAFPLADTEAA